MEKKQIGDNYKYVIVFACMLLSACSVGMVTFVSGLFVVPVTDDLGVSRAAFSLTSTIGTLVAIGLLPFVGGIFKRFPTKRLLLIGTVCAVVALWVNSFAKSIYVLYICSVLGGTGTCLFGFVPINIIIADWFTEKRGVYTGIAFTGSALASALLSPTISNIIAKYGWRMGYRFNGTFILVVMSLTILFLVREKKTQTLQQFTEAQRVPVAEGLTRREAVRTSTFWAFAIAVFFIGLVASSTQQQMVAYWTDMGNSREFAAKMYSMVLFISIIAKVVLGFLYDRMSTKASSILLCGITFLSFIGLLFFYRGVGLIVPVVFFGLTTAVQVVIPSLMTRKLFGDRDYPSIYGTITTAMYIGIASGIPLCASVYDLFGNYRIAWILFAVVAVLTLAALLTANRLSERLPQHGAAKQA